MKMNRRAILSGLMGLGVAELCSARAARAAHTILGGTQFGPLHRAFVNQPQPVIQACAEWCWAASASMIFAGFGHPIDQMNIVSRVFGNPVCLSSGAGPFGPTGTITAVLSTSWTDMFGRPFQSRVRASYDSYSQIYNINNAYIVNELIQDRPILYANTYHCMVIIAVDYIDTPIGPNIQAAHVLDPFPSNPRVHPLSNAEIVPIHSGGQMTYLASVSVT